MLTIILTTVASIYILANVVIYFWQDKFLFKPEKLPANFEFKYPNLDFKEHNLVTESNVKISAIHFQVENPKGVVFYLKGNSRSIKGWGKFAVDFTRQGFDVVMVDYRGFGKSTGKMSEEGMKKDLQYVYDKIKERVEEKFIILYGRSLGSGFAAKLASLNNPRMLILESPYYSLTNVTKRYVPFMPMSLIMRYPLKTYRYLHYVKCPIKIVHGTNDKLIPLKSSIKLSKIKLNSTRLYPIIGAGHNNLHTFEEYHRILEEILHSKLPGAIDPTNSSISFKRGKVKR